MVRPGAIPSSPSPGLTPGTQLQLSALHHMEVKKFVYFPPKKSQVQVMIEPATIRLRDELGNHWIINTSNKVRSPELTTPYLEIDMHSGFRL